MRPSSKKRRASIVVILFLLVLSVGVFTSAKRLGSAQEVSGLSPTRERTSTLPVTQQPTLTATLALTPTPIPPPLPVANGEMWISRSELSNLSATGDAWEYMASVAYADWSRADLKDQGNEHAINTLAGAFVYARTSDPLIRIKVRDRILAAKRTLDEEGERQRNSGVLAASRQLGAYIIAADLIDLKNFDGAADQEFRSWLTSIRTTNIGTHGRWRAIAYTCENSASNWGTFACASRIAASIYLGDAADVDRAAAVIRAYFGERRIYPRNAPGRNGYFQHTAGFETSWSCAEPSWTGINPPCVKEGLNLDGALVEDASRGGGCCVLQGAGIMYSWEALQGLFVSAELLYQTGRYGNPYDWSDQALRRALDFMQRSGWGITKPATYIPWLANARYGASYLVSPTSGGGRIMSWGDWLYQR